MMPFVPLAVRPREPLAPSAPCAHGERKPGELCTYPGRSDLLRPGRSPCRPRGACARFRRVPGLVLGPPVRSTSSLLAARPARGARTLCSAHRPLAPETAYGFAIPRTHPVFCLFRLLRGVWGRRRAWPRPFLGPGVLPGASVPAPSAAVGLQQPQPVCGSQALFLPSFSPPPPPSFFLLGIQSYPFLCGENSAPWPCGRVWNIARPSHASVLTRGPAARTFRAFPGGPGFPG